MKLWLTKNKNPDPLKKALTETLEIAKTLNVYGYQLRDDRYIHLAELVNGAVTEFLLKDVKR